jgi:hypothetical protein
LTKDWLGCILGDFFHKLIWSPWPHPCKRFAQFPVLSLSFSFFISLSLSLSFRARDSVSKRKLLPLRFQRNTKCVACQRGLYISSHCNEIISKLKIHQSSHFCLDGSLSFYAILVYVCMSCRKRHFLRNSCSPVSISTSAVDLIICNNKTRGEHKIGSCFGSSRKHKNR